MDLSRVDVYRVVEPARIGSTRLPLIRPSSQTENTLPQNRSSTLFDPILNLADFLVFNWSTTGRGAYPQLSIPKELDYNWSMATVETEESQARESAAAADEHRMRTGVSPPAGRLGSADIASLLRRDIEAGQLLPQERLPPERVLAATYGVARGTVREALLQLAETGLVETRAGSGSYVTNVATNGQHAVIASARPIELIDARFALEPHICRLAVLRAGQEEFDRMDQELEIMEASTEDPLLFAEADTRFHSLLAKSAGNVLLDWFMAEINSVRNQEQWSMMRNLTLNEATIEQYNRDHRLILQSVRSREPERAATVMKEHLERARLSLTRAAAI